MRELSARLGQIAISLGRTTKRGIAVSADAALCVATCYASVVLRIGFFPQRDMPFALLTGVSLGFALPIFWAVGLYREIFSQTGMRAIVRIARACLIYTVPFAFVFSFARVFGIPRTTTLIQPLLLFVGVAASRLAAHFWLFDAQEARTEPQRRVIIYGAGPAGRQLAGALARARELLVVGYFDDDPKMIGSVLDGVRIYPPARMQAAAQRLRASEILLALPTAPIGRRNEIVSQARGANLRIRTLPRFTDLSDGRIELAQLREMDIEDLLGRPPVAPDRESIREGIAGRRILVTGAGGTIGGELCRQVVAHGPAVLLLLELNEFALYEIHRELERLIAETTATVRIVPLLGSVCDAARVEEIVDAWRPQSIYHAAAYKHVPLVERNPAEGVRTNILGVEVLAHAAIRARVSDFILVSTDKAVRPTSVMGATKRAAELALQALDPIAPATRFSIVRFGNVLGSSGSVVPLFREQIARGGPVTLTDWRITRYFMTVTEAVELVLQAATLSDGGEVFLLDMGQPVAIAELARSMIELGGLSVRSADNPHGDIELVEVGLRPGEKLYEELLLGAELVPTSHARIFKSNEPRLSLAEFETRLNGIRAAMTSGDRALLLQSLTVLVPEFHPSADIADWVHLETAAYATVPRIATVA
jgi:FlaA1/EpsC-like NDP-sugar epimerase